MIKDSIALVAQNLRHRQKRSLLTMIGIFIGIAAVVSLMSLGEGMQKAVLSQFASVGADKVIVQAKSSGFGPPGALAAGKITDKDLEAIARVQGVVDSAGRLLKVATIEFNDIQRAQFIASLPNSDDATLIIETNNYKPTVGRMLKPADSGKVVVGSGLAAKEIFGKEMRIGNKLHISGRAFEVIGILGNLGDPARNNAVVMNQDDLRDVLGIDDEELSVIVARAGENEDPNALAARVSQALRRSRNEREGKETFQVQTSAQLIDSFVTIISMIQAVLVGIALISLFVGGIGITNTMYTAVLERTREIGIMKAIGGTRGQILSVFVIESGTLGMVGGAIGVVIGMTMSKLVELAAKNVLGTDLLAASFPWYLIVGALGFSFVIGSLAGLVPAIRASRLQVVEALRD